jgi:transcriptional regulator with XRE-family HTH domain
VPAFDLRPLQLLAPADTQRMLADRIRAARVAAELKQSTLAARAGVSLASLRLFEQRGEISLKHLMRICHALGRLDEFEAMFKPPVAATMAQLEARSSGPTRKRGSR